MVAPKVIAGIAFGACALLAIAYFLGALTPGPPAPAAAPAAKASPKPPTATTQSGVVLLPGETLVSPPDPLPAAPAPATSPAPAAQKPAAKPSPPRYTPGPKAPVAAREAPRPAPPRATRSVCVNCGVVTSVARTDYDWEVRVRFDDGSREVLRFYDRPRAQVGDAVRLEDGRLHVDN